MAGPPRIALRTERFRLDGLGMEAATPAVAAWFADPEIAGPLNLRPRIYDLDRLRREFGAGNGRTLFLVGVRELGGGPLLGYYRLERDPLHLSMHFNVVIGDRAWWGKGVVLETRAALLDHVFAERGVEKAIGLPLARNVPAIFNYQRQGWRQEGLVRGRLKAADGSGRLDQVQFGLLASEWTALREATE